jgi:hypothetical protein
MSFAFPSSVKWFYDDQSRQLLHRVAMALVINLTGRSANSP